jgi:rifampicin phosphotransferase
MAASRCDLAHLDRNANLGLEPWRNLNDRRADNPSVRWTRGYADEIRGAPLSPAFYSLTPFHGFPQMFHLMHGAGTVDLRDRFKYQHASGYTDVTLVKRIYEYQPRSFRRSAVLDLFPPDLRAEVATARFRWLGRLRRTYEMEVRHGSTRSLRRVAERIEKLVPEFERQMAKLTSTRLADLSDESLHAHRSELTSIAGWFGAPCGDAVMFHANDLRLALVAALDRWVGDGERRYAAVSTGLPESRTVRETNRLYQIARQLSAVPGALEALRPNGSWESLIETVRRSDSPELATILEHFRSEHGHRGAHYKDVIHPRWGDNPELLHAVLRGIIADHTESPADRHRAAGQARLAAQSEASQEITGPFGFVKRRVLQWLFRWNDVYALVRDDHRFHFDRVWCEHRRILSEWGRRLNARGLLEELTDVFFLGADEVEQAWRTSVAPTSQVVAARKATFEHARNCTGPRYLRGDEPEGEDTQNPGGELTGLPASPGVAIGIARVILDISDLDRVQRNEIVITRQTDPSWSPVFPRIAGLVLETGGVLAHGASLCREYALPCVTAVLRAAEWIPDGSLIEVDGARGTVRILSTN